MGTCDIMPPSTANSKQQKGGFQYGDCSPQSVHICRQDDLFLSHLFSVKSTSQNCVRVFLYQLYTIEMEMTVKEGYSLT